MRKDIKLDIAINYVCYWFIFRCLMLKQAEKECKTLEFSVFPGISLVVAFEKENWTVCRI